MQKCKSTECNHCSYNDIPDFCRKWDTTLDKIKEVFKKPVETIFDLEDVYNNVKQILYEDEKIT